jgi:16S rRNA (uracil1498-N3)-methyltransferase
MPINRFFDPNLTSDTKEGILEGDEFNHATKSFRLKHLDKIELINGKGALAQAFVTAVSKKHLSYEVESFHQEPQKVAPATLVLGMPKFNRLEIILEKITELGCLELVLFNADRSEKLDLSKNQWQRIELILVAALKQSGRLFFPSISVKPHLEECFESDRNYFFGDLDAQEKHLPKNPTKLGFVIGPESGLSDKEKSLLNKKATGLLLSDATLRVDTAAIVSVFLMQQAF